MLGKVVVLSEEEETVLQQQLQSPLAAAEAEALFSRVSQHPSVFSILSRVSTKEDHDLMQDILRGRIERAIRLQAWAAALDLAEDRLLMDDPNATNLVAEVSPKEPKVYVSPINREVGRRDTRMPI